jgi:broad specificity phosphatase PhoE
MTEFLLMRHGQPDYSGPHKWNAPGWGADLAPLTEIGEKQVLRQIDEINKFDPNIVITSPTTRAIHSALVLRQVLKVPFRVEFELHEWVPDLSFQWKTLTEVEKLQSEYESLDGKWPFGETRPWEQVESVRMRVVKVFQSYLKYDRVLVVCHGQVIQALTSVNRIDLAGLLPYSLTSYSI